MVDDADSVSVDPSDGLGWCECEACAAMGSISDRAVTLANAVAQGLEGSAVKILALDKTRSARPSGGASAHEPANKLEVITMADSGLLRPVICPFVLRARDRRAA